MAAASASRGGDASVEVSDFVIGAAAGSVSGTVFGSAYPDAFDASLVTLADVAPGDRIRANLVITDALNRALSTTFAGGGAFELTGQTFGAASTSPVPVPLLPLLAAGLGRIGLAGARRRAA